MNKPTLTSLFLYSDGSIEIKITEDKDQVTTITLTSEKMKGLDLDQRFEAAKKRANAYIACVIRENEVVKGPFDALPFPEVPINDLWKEEAELINKEESARIEVMAQSELS